MLLTGVKIASLALVVGLLTLQAPGDAHAAVVVQKKPGLNADAAEVSGQLKEVDAKKGVIVVTVAAPIKGQPAEDKTLALAKDVKVALDDGRGFKSVSFRPGSLADLKEGALIQAELSKDQKEVVAIRAQGPTVGGVLKAVDAAKNLVTITFRKKGQDDQDKTYAVAQGAKIVIDGKDARFMDLAADALVTARLAGDQKALGMILIEGPTIQGLVKAVDPAKNAVTLTMAKKGQPSGEDYTYEVAKDAKITAYGKDTRLKDLPIGAQVSAKLLSNRTAVRVIEAQGPSVRGVLKAVDAVKNTVTVLVSSKTRPAEEKTFTVSKDASIGIAGGKAGALRDLIADRQVTLWLSMDEKQVVSISSGKAGK